MPPYVPRKRSRSPLPSADPPRKRIATNRKSVPKSDGKKHVFHAVDGLSKPDKRSRSLEENQKFLDAQEASDTGGGSDSSASDDSDEFEDVLPDGDGPPVTKDPPGAHNSKRPAEDSEGEDEASDDDAISTGSNEWHDLLPNVHKNDAAPGPSGDLQLTLPKANEQPDYSQWAAARETTGKKGPSKIERQIRVQTHCMHVQYLLFHNLVRNSWIQDKEVQKILLATLSENCWKEVNIWREAVGLPELRKDGNTTAQKTDRKTQGKASEKDQKKSKGKAKDKAKKDDPRSHRDWSHTATRDPENPPHDGLPRLLQYLLSFWRKIFKPTSPSLRKIGYLESAALQAHMRAYRKDNKDTERFGERITSLADFRECAKQRTGSRDVGQQLFTGLLRAVGIEARMVCSLQPVGFGWSKAEEGKLKKPGQKSSEPAANEDDLANAKSKKVTKNLARKSKTGGKGSKTAPIDLGSDSSELSDPPSDSGSDLSIVDLTPSKSVTPARKGYPHTHPVPTYWTEAFSPVTNRPHAASPLAAPHIASTPEAFQGFEPRGKEAEKAKQVLAYVVAFSSDGTAKDVTVRYLKRRMWPGKTKGMRLPVEKIPVYNKHGKVKRYEEYDWFKSVLSDYRRDVRHRTQADEQEDTGDLVPVKPSKKEKEENLDTLSGLKASADYVLERFMRREEALLPTAKPVRNFTSGKGDKAKTEPVYSRADVVSCKTVESWHKEGREIIPGSQALKRVPHRAVTIARKQEIIDHERETGEKPLQGLYSKAQTQYIIPPPIEDGRIPRNAFGNIDVYVPSMVPKGATHIPLRGTMRICKKLGIDFAEACVGFEFGAQRAVPVIHGVVVAEGHRKLVRDAWHEEQQRQKEKEAIKREAKALALWKKFLTGMRIIERVKAEYGTGVGESADINPFVHKKGDRKQQIEFEREQDDEDTGFKAHDEDQAGGFFMPGHDEEEVAPRKLPNERVDADDNGGGFLPDADDDAASAMEGGGFTLEAHATKSRSASPDVPMHDYPQTPISLQSAHQQGKTSANRVSVNARMNRRRRAAEEKAVLSPPTLPEVQADTTVTEDIPLPTTTPSRKRRARTSKGAKASSPSKDRPQPARVVPKRQATKRASTGTGTKSKYFEESDVSEA